MYNPTYCLSKISHNPFPNIKLNNTSTKEIERIIRSIRVKNLHGYDGITTKMYCSTYVLLYLLSNMETLRNITCFHAVEEFGKEVSGSLSNDCRVTRRAASSSSQIVPQTKAIDDASLQGIYKLSHSWVTVTTAVTTNISKCVLKGILVQILGVEALQICLFYCPPHMLDRNNVN
jgi:hypothetical protein